MYILLEKENYHIEFYSGKTYKHQGEIYPCTTKNIKEAKIYNSKKIGQNACYKLNNKTGRDFKVYFIKDLI